jgi:hypothetical protein
MNDGTFGVTGSAESLDSDMIERLENHTFDSVRNLQWRNRVLEFQTLDRLRDSLREMPRESRLTRARMAVPSALVLASHLLRLFSCRKSAISSLVPGAPFPFLA